MSLITKLFKPVCKVVCNVFKPAAKAAKPAAKKVVTVPVGKAATEAAKKPKRSLLSAYIEKLNECHNSKEYQEYKEIFNKGVSPNDWQYLW